MKPPKNIPVLPGRVVCLILVGKSWLLGVSDKTKTSPAFVKRMPDGALIATRHAEMHALQLAKKQKAKVKKMLVLRFGARGNVTMARPCKHCQKNLRESGIRPSLIQYSDFNSTIRKMEGWDD